VDDLFETHITNVAGYAFVVAHNDKIVAEGASGFARTPADPPQTPWTVPTRVNLASVSKCITAVTLLRILHHSGVRIEDPFYPLTKAKCPVVGAGVASVTFQNLLEMKSGMVEDGTLETPDICTFLSRYLQQPLVGTPGTTSVYSNTNFTILQAIISLLADPANHGGNGVDPYVHHVTDHVLKPMGVDTAVFNPIPDPPARATLSYTFSDNGPGQYWGPFNCIGLSARAGQVPHRRSQGSGARSTVDPHDVHRAAGVVRVRRRRREIITITTAGSSTEAIPPRD
jgi:CubicO group peptidase (beta-lactamase class C family)